MTDELHRKDANSRWNFAVNLLDISGFHLGMSFVFASTVMPLYASHLTSSAVLIGLVPAVQQAAYYLPQVLSARRGERLSRMKPVVARISVLERLPFLLIALSILLAPAISRGAAYSILLGCLLISSAAAGIGAPMWKTMLAKVIAPDRRGTLFGTGIAIGGLLGIAGSAISRHFLSSFDYPTSFGLCFLAAFGGQVLSWTGLALNREPAVTPPAIRGGRDRILRWVVDELQANNNLSRYLLSQALVIFGTMGISFYIVYARVGFEISNAFAGTLTMFALVSQAIGTLILGRLADKMGHKWLTELATLFGLAAILIIFFAKTTFWLFPTFFFMNLSVSTLNVARLSITMEFSEPHRLPRVTAVCNTAIAAPLLFAPLVGGWIVDSLGYPTLFATAAAFSIAGWVILHFFVVDPRIAALARGSGNR
jgi:MFS family permease